MVHRLLCALAFVALLSVATSTTLPKDLKNVASVQHFVAGPTAADWYEHEDTNTFLQATWMCGAAGYAWNVHFGCAKSKEDDTFFTPETSEVAICAFGGPINWFAFDDTYNIGADVMTGACTLGNTETCGHPECNNQKLYLNGGSYIIKYTYSLTNPELQYPSNPPGNGGPLETCDYIFERNRRMGNGTTRFQSGRNKRNHPIDSDTPDGGVAPTPAEIQYNRNGAANTPPVPLPENVWRGSTYIFSGSFYAMDNKSRKIQWGTYEMVWPYNNGRDTFKWHEVPSSTVPSNAYFVKNPYRLDLQFWDDDHHERY